MRVMRTPNYPAIITGSVMLATAGIIGLWDAVVQLSGHRVPSATDVIYDLSLKYPVLLILVGFAMGYTFRGKK